MPVKPTNAVDSAISKAKQTTHWAVGMCDNFVANMYGYSSSGYATALVNWNSTPSNLRHPGDMNAPAGALMYWGGGDGHVALSLGNGSIVSTDIGGNGTVTTVPATAISTKWGKTYLGWSYPYFQGKQASNTLGGITGSTPVGAEQAGLGSLDPDTITNSFLDSFMQPFGKLLNMMVWGSETLLGVVLVGVGIFIIAKDRK